MAPTSLEQFEKKLRETVHTCARTREELTLVVVTKKQSIESISTLYKKGVRDFGENRVQELVEKASLLPHDITWHYIGPLQRNKVKALLQLPVVIHSIDRLSILQELVKVARQTQSPVRGFLQVNISNEPQKGGFSVADLIDLLQNLPSYPNFICMGLMTMTPAEAQVKERLLIFSTLRKLRDENLPEGALSMGMSGDFVEAVQCGATYIRIGRALFAH
jgi:pyridoxal phosphate enzyme (YggS family)